MNTKPQFLRQASFRVRPRFLAGCTAILVVLVLPSVTRDSHAIQGALLLFAAMAILVGCILLLVDRPKMTWRTGAVVIASVYLAVSLPVFVFEMSQVKWFMKYPRHALLSMYAKPWVHWGYILIPLGVICSFLGKGRARIALVIGAMLLLVIWEAMGTWVF